MVKSRHYASARPWDNRIMVSAIRSLPAVSDEAGSIARIASGLNDESRRRLHGAWILAHDVYAESRLGSGESTLAHAQGMSLIIASLDLDADTRIGALLFALADHQSEAVDLKAKEFGPAVAQLVDGLTRLKQLRPLTRAAVGRPDVASQTEILRKMLLAMSTDIRVVLLRLASRTQTLRYLSGLAEGAGLDPEMLRETARESLAIYAPLANRLGVWQLKWELEDMSFRFLEPETYRRIAGMLDETRDEREDFIDIAIMRLSEELEALGIKAEVYGRPKHIYSIWNKMRGKNIDFEQVHDVRAVRVVVPEIRDCYTVLGIVHHLWQPIHGEFDDYISHPKGNYYRSLHTAVAAADGRSLEIQIRTPEMHRHAELGVAAHWRYKEAGSSARAEGEYEDKISWLRQLLSWRDEITDSKEWVQEFKRAALDDSIYVLTPQGRVVDLTRGATPVDFAYRLHTDLGHHCRGARINGHMVPLNTPLANGQQIEIIAAKSGGPSRDWLNPEAGYIATSRARQKVKQWFAAQEESDMLAQGRVIVTKELQREGQTQANLEELAARLGLKSPDALFLAAARGEVGHRALQVALRGAVPPAAPEPEIHTRKSRAGEGQVLIVGVDKLLTQIGRCCKPMPPDAISGFVTRGKGVSIHRLECRNFRNMAARNPERVIDADWGRQSDSIYATDFLVDATDRQGLLRDISEVLSRERINLTAIKTQSRAGSALMSMTVELPGAASLQRTLALLREVPGVVSVKRA
jgi:GTP pyrophosphokinase